MKDSLKKPNKNKPKEHKHLEKSEMKEDLAKKAFLVLIVLSLIGTLIIIKPYVGTIVLAFITVLIFHPVYEALGRKTKWSPMLRTILVGLLLAAVIVIPISLLIVAVVSEVPGAISTISETVGEGSIESITADLEEQAAELTSNEEISSAIEKALESVVKVSATVVAALASVATKLISGIVTSIVPLFTNMIIFVAVFVMVMPSVKKIKNFLNTVSPFEKDITEKFVNRTMNTSKDMILASLVIAVLSGFIVGITFALLGIPYAGIAALLSMVFGVVPLVGPSLVTIPTAILLVVVNDDWVGAIIIVLVQLLIIGQVDLMVRPFFFKGDTKMNPVIVGIAVMGGIAAFGLLGIIYGPLIVIILITCLEIYIPEYFIPDMKKTEKKEGALKKWLKKTLPLGKKK